MTGAKEKLLMVISIMREANIYRKITTITIRSDVHSMTWYNHVCVWQKS
jgi:hypothetical protein